MRCRMKFRFHVRLGKRHREQAPEEKLVVCRQAERAEDSHPSGLLVAAGIGVVVFRGVNEVFAERRFGIERTQRMFDQGQLAVTAAAWA